MKRILMSIGVLALVAATTSCDPPVAAIGLQPLLDWHANQPAQDCAQDFDSGDDVMCQLVEGADLNATRAAVLAVVTGRLSETPPALLNTYTPQYLASNAVAFSVPYGNWYREEDLFKWFGTPPLNSSLTSTVEAPDPFHVGFILQRRDVQIGLLKYQLALTCGADADHTIDYTITNQNVVPAPYPSYALIFDDLEMTWNGNVLCGLEVKINDKIADRFGFAATVSGFTQLSDRA